MYFTRKTHNITSFSAGTVFTICRQTMVNRRCGARQKALDSYTVSNTACWRPTVSHQLPTELRPVCQQNRPRREHTAPVVDTRGQFESATPLNRAIHCRHSLWAASRRCLRMGRSRRWRRGRDRAWRSRRRCTGPAARSRWCADASPASSVSSGAQTPATHPAARRTWWAFSSNVLRCPEISSIVLLPHSDKE